MITIKHVPSTKKQNIITPVNIFKIFEYKADKNRTTTDIFEANK